MKLKDLIPSINEAEKADCYVCKGTGQGRMLRYSCKKQQLDDNGKCNNGYKNLTKCNRNCNRISGDVGISPTRRGVNENFDKVAGGFPYKMVGSKAVISEPMDDETKERMIKRAKSLGHSAGPNMAGGITIMPKQIQQKSSVSPLILKKVNVLVDGEKTDVSIRYNPYKDLQDVIISWGEESHTVDFDAEDVIDDHGNEGKDMSFVAFSENDKWRFIVDVSVEYNYENSGNIQEIMWDSLEIDIDDLKKESKMKKFQLRNIIKESIKELMTEQNNPPAYTMSNIQDAITALQNGNYMYSTNGYGVIHFTYHACVAEAEAAGVVTPGQMPGSGNTYGVNGSFNQSVFQHYNPQVHSVSQLTSPTSLGYGITDSLENLAANPNSGFYDNSTDASAGCSAFNISAQVHGCIYPNACNYDPNANHGGPGGHASLCTWGPAGPNYGQLENPHPCPPTPVVIEGCMDPLASNYDATATQDDGSCMYPAGSGTTATLDRGPQMATPDRTKNDPDVTQDNPQVRRMRELANIKNK